MDPTATAQRHMEVEATANDVPNGNYIDLKKSGLIVELDSFSFFSVDRDADEYFMGHTKRGKAYIFNHEHFDANPWLNQRTGTNKDRDDLCAILKDYDFDVTVFNDLTLKELNKEIKKLAAEDHSENDCVLVALMSHGDEYLLYAKDQEYKPEKLWSHFTSDQCPTLEGKPKIFFIQACRGDRLDAGISMVPPMTVTDADHQAFGGDRFDSSTILSPTTERNSQLAATLKIPCDHDFIIGYSTVFGFKSWRNQINGSWFIQSLCYVLSERGRKDDLLSLMTTVSQRVSIEYESHPVPQDLAMYKCKQIPSIMSSLTRKIYFKSKKSSSLSPQSLSNKSFCDII